jgi:hypothetical protein
MRKFEFGLKTLDISPTLINFKKRNCPVGLQRDGARSFIIADSGLIGDAAYPTDGLRRVPGRYGVRGYG